MSTILLSSPHIPHSLHILTALVVTAVFTKTSTQQSSASLSTNATVFSQDIFNSSSPETPSQGFQLTTSVIAPTTTQVSSFTRTLLLVYSVSSLRPSSSDQLVEVSQSTVMLKGSGFVTTLMPNLTSSEVVQPSPTSTLDDKDDESTTSLPLSIGAIIGIAAGGVGFFLLVLCCLFCCWYQCCHFSQKDQYRTGAEYKITAQYWTQGSAQYTITRQDSLSSRSRMSSIRSSLGMRPKVYRHPESSETYENQQAVPEFYSTPV